MTKHIHLTKSAEIISVPPSKSHAQRVLFAIALTKQSAIINNLGGSDDVLYVLEIIKQLGFTVDYAGDKVLIQKDSEPSNNQINVGESGLGTRLSVPILSHFFDHYSINGSGTILNRSMKWFLDYLPQTGINISLINNRLPLQANGKIESGIYVVDGSKSSQYISGLLMTLPLCKANSTLIVTNPTSIPYIDITLKVLDDFNIKIENENYLKYKIPGNQLYFLDDLQYTIEGDFSGAAFWIVYGLLTDGISISNLNPQSVQADKAILKIVEAVDGVVNWTENTLTIRPPEQLKTFHFDAENCPDLFPILTVLALGIRGTSSIKGIHRLSNKESDRATVLFKEFSKLGAEMKIHDNTLIINGTGQLKTGVIQSFNDHRIAMSSAIASILTPSGIGITNPNCVNKSYNTFWETANNL
ncbi:MAG: 3-phosphoshikimate 1-carboxyvinyltransferase [Crocinitomicaceae bacterium]